MDNNRSIHKLQNILITFTLNCFFNLRQRFSKISLIDESKLFLNLIFQPNTFLDFGDGGNGLQIHIACKILSN